ncbi:MAG: beta-ketoacyl synthase N-terminal-like domain-containing protein [Acidobacteriota bacterium]
MTDYRERLTQAIRALEVMQGRVDALERMRSEPVAIIGMGCRFPGKADQPEAFWGLLHDGVDAITEVPADRWPIDEYYDPDPSALGKMTTRYGGFIDQLQEFDAHFFGISPQEAETLDPQQRLLLEVSWEALEHAGIVPDSLMDTSTGVFIGMCSNDYAQLAVRRPNELIDGYLATGSAHSTAAGRISYLLGLKGPSLAVDTACSSSLVAMHVACQSLRQHDCDLALVGGVNCILTPELTITFSKAQMLAADGRCKTFDAAADGFIRSEGCGMIVLKRLSDAMAAQDNILAVVRGTAVNQDGRTAGLTVPNGPSQQAVIQKALADAGVDPAQVNYVETHGTGTALGDPIEVGSLGAVFGSSHTPTAPLLIGSVKTNLGHLEGAASIAGVIKVVLALQHDQLPPHLHYRQPNPHMAWDRLPIAVTKTGTPWPAGQGRRLAGVSGFGFGGTNAHAVLEEAPPQPDSRDGREFPVVLLTLSAKTEAARQALTQRYAQWIAEHPDSSPGNLCLAASTRRSHFPYRLAVEGSSLAELGEGLAAFLAGREHRSIWSGKAGPATSRGQPLPPEGEDAAQWRAYWRDLAQAYVQGADVDWTRVYHGSRYRRIPLPTYPFQRKRYWLTPAQAPPEPTRQPPPPPDEPPRLLSSVLDALSSHFGPPMMPAQHAALGGVLMHQLDVAAQTLTQLVAQQLEALRHSRRPPVAAGVPAPQPAQPVSPAPLAERPAHLLAWSAATADDLETATITLAAQLSPSMRNHGNVLAPSGLSGAGATSAIDSARDARPYLRLEPLRPSAHSLRETALLLRAGDPSGPHRRVLVARDAADALAALERRESKRLLTRASAADTPPLAFMFPGLGDHYVHMARDIYACEPDFRQWLDRGAALLQAEFHFDPRPLLYPETEPEAARPTPSDAESTIDLKRMLGRQPQAGMTVLPFHQPLCSQSSVFLVEYALARLLMSWGVRPQAMIGYSIGEYVAASLADVFTFEDGLRLVARRAQLIETLAGGVMLAVPLPEGEIRALLGAEVDVAAVSSAMQCMVAGPETAIVRVEQQLQARNVVFRRLPATHAFHTPHLRPIQNEFMAVLRSTPLRQPSIPYISNLTGRWISEQQATAPEYWVDHTCQTVRFADGVQTLLETPGRIFVEVGAGQGLCSFAAQQAKRTARAVRAIIPVTRTAYAAESDEAVLLTAVGRVWLNGGTVDWAALYR